MHVSFHRLVVQMHHCQNLAILLAMVSLKVTQLKTRRLETALSMTAKVGGWYLRWRGQASAYSKQFDQGLSVGNKKPVLETVSSRVILLLNQTKFPEVHSVVF